MNAMTQQEHLEYDFTSLSVLYVEDDEVTRELLAVFLKRHVGNLYLAADGAEGLELFRRQKPQVVITDIQMPVMDGLKMAEMIRDIDPAVPIIIFTDHYGLGRHMQAAHINVNKFVAKPIKHGHLLQCLHDCQSILTGQLSETTLDTDSNTSPHA